ncbi:unnamed protein product [Didymodactylos carnosus]|uniref:Uncharacterized protein n=1 Tax=Didymodactylos carnosus TaxID=1234261 RepID=A0A815R5Q2_9BILA|nr:unnamed protein product [Didymodactylos carnosus]CAF4339003.1 unnamed protein product [Didymodactylos carnosus]
MVAKLFIFSVVILCILNKIKISSTLDCYQCGVNSGYNEYPYIITLDNIPEFKNCTVVSTDEPCTIQFRFQGAYQINATTIVISDETEHYYNSSLIRTTVSYSGGMGQDSIDHELEYFCYEDKCNDPKKLKLLLQSATVEPFTKDQIKWLIVPTSPPSIPIPCMHHNNWTSLDSDCIDEDVEVCQSCNTDIVGSITTQVCAVCSYGPLFANSYYDVSQQFLYGNRDRVRQLHVQCTVPNCNTIASIEGIKKLYKNEIDVKIFLNETTSRAIIKCKSISVIAILFWTLLVRFKME